MEHIQEALIKAHASLEDQPVRSAAPSTARPMIVSHRREPQWTPPSAELNTRTLERNRIVSYGMSDAGHVPFNMLRTKVRAMLGENGWKTIGITSPTPACGKTTIGINLGLSMARGGDIRTVLIDLDLPRPGVARALGLQPRATIGKFLQGQGHVEECFVQVAPGLIVGMGGGHLPESSELMQSKRMAELLEFIGTALAADVVLVDLPPMGSSDDTMAFLSHADGMLLVAAAGQSTVAQLDECERQLAEQEKFLGLVLNKSPVEANKYYY